MLNLNEAQRAIQLYHELSHVDMSDYYEKETSDSGRQLFYLSWGVVLWALHALGHEVSYNLKMTETIDKNGVTRQCPYIGGADGTAMVEVEVTIDGITKAGTLPVYASKGSAAAKVKPTMADIDAAKQRCFVKVVACNFGLGALLYADPQGEKKLAQTMGDSYVKLSELLKKVDRPVNIVAPELATQPPQTAAKKAVNPEQPRRGRGRPRKVQPAEVAQAPSKPVLTSKQQAKLEQREALAEVVAEVDRRLEAKKQATKQAAPAQKTTPQAETPKIETPAPTPAPVAPHQETATTENTTTPTPTQTSSEKVQVVIRDVALRNTRRFGTQEVVPTECGICPACKDKIIHKETKDGVTAWLHSTVDDAHICFGLGFDVPVPDNDLTKIEYVEIPYGQS